MKHNDVHVSVPSPRTQRGMALITSLIFLALLTLIGVTAMQTTTMEERMAGNLVSETEAFQRAEGTLEEVRRTLTGGTLNLSDFNGNSGRYGFGASPDVQADTTWTGSSSAQANNHDDARYVIALKTPPGNPVVEPGSGCTGTGCNEGHVFEVTARATDESGRATVTLQASYWKQN